jgi:hypothetical protein
VLGFGEQPGLLNEPLVGTQGNVLHTEAVYTVLVWPASAL